MQLPDISSLPPWLALVFVVCAAITYVVIKVGFKQGFTAPASAAAQAQVAAVIVDPTALNRATAAVGDLTEGVVDLVREIREVRSELVIQREISRRGRG